MPSDHAAVHDDEDDEPASKVGGVRGDRAIGKAYRAKKAGGDVKLKNKPDPYAFVPFDGNRLNRRKKAKAVGEFKGMMKGVKRGAAKAAMKKKKRPTR